LIVEHRYEVVEVIRVARSFIPKYKVSLILALFCCIEILFLKLLLQEKSLLRIFFVIERVAIYLLIFI
jgi:hypothetical protein